MNLCKSDKFVSPGHVALGQQMLFLLTIIIFPFLLSWLCNFENVSDLKFFMSGVVPFAGIPFAVYTRFLGPDDKVFILPCEELSNPRLIGSSLNPILFKSCISTNKSLPLDHFATFPDSSTNIFPNCGAKPLIRNFTYEDLRGNIQEIIEAVPCHTLTLKEKINDFLSHDASRDGKYYDVNVFLLTNHNVEKFENDFKAKGLIPRDFSLSQVGALLSIIGHFFASDTTAVNYFHSHMDRFLSFGIEATKVWELVNPKYHDSFNYQWTGNAILPTLEKSNTPKLYIEQEPGDIVFIPPWWLHKTYFPEESTGQQTKTASVNIHMMTSRSLVGVVSAIFMATFGNTHWFYNSKINQKLFEEHGLVH